MTARHYLPRIYFLLVLIFLIIIIPILILIPLSVNLLSWLTYTDTHLYTIHHSHSTLLYHAMPCYAMLCHDMLCCSDQSTSLSGKPTSSLFEFCVENRYECLATQQVMLSTYLSIHRILILLLVFSISYVMCGVWCVVYTCVRVSWAVWCSGHNLLHVYIPFLDFTSFPP